MHGAGWSESGLEGAVPYMSCPVRVLGWSACPVEGVDGGGGGGYPCNLGYFVFFVLPGQIGLAGPGAWSEVAGAVLRMNGTLCVLLH